MGILVTIYVRIHVCMYARVCMQGTDSFDGVIHTDSFESVFWMDTFEGVHLCACMCTVHSISRLL